MAVDRRARRRIERQPERREARPRARRRTPVGAVGCPRRASGAAHAVGPRHASCGSRAIPPRGAAPGVGIVSHRWLRCRSSPIHPVRGRVSPCPSWTALPWRLPQCGCRTVEVAAGRASTGFSTNLAGGCRFVDNRASSGRATRPADRPPERPPDDVDDLVDVLVGLALLGRGPDAAADVVLEEHDRHARPPRRAGRPSAAGCRRSTPRARSSGRCREPGPPSATGDGRAGPCPSNSCGGSGSGRLAVARAARSGSSVVSLPVVAFAPSRRVRRNDTPWGYPPRGSLRDRARSARLAADGPSRSSSSAARRRHVHRLRRDRPERAHPDPRPPRRRRLRRARLPRLWQRGARPPPADPRPTARRSSTSTPTARRRSRVGGT